MKEQGPRIAARALVFHRVSCDHFALAKRAFTSFQFTTSHQLFR
jgi:hypothetical protein